MPVDKQLSVFIENKPGQLSQICGILADNSVNITAITVHDAVDHGMVRLIVDNSTKALLLLEQAEFYVLSHDVVVIEIENRPGIIASVSKKLFRADINIEYAYFTAVKNQDTSCLVIKTKDAEQTIEVLEEL